MEEFCLVSIAGSKPTGFQPVSFEQPVPLLDNRRNGGIQAKRARGIRSEVPRNLVHQIQEESTARTDCRAGARFDTTDMRRAGCGHRAVSPDHIHLLLSAPPILAPAKLAQYIKGRASRHLQAEFPELRKQYWGQHMWARGYFCATVGAVDEATIKTYIENQRWDEDDESFKITAPTKP